MGVHEVGVVNVGEGVANVKGCGHYLRAVPLILVLSTVYTRRELGASANFLATPFISVITSHSGASSSYVNDTERRKGYLRMVQYGNCHS